MSNFCVPIDEIDLVFVGEVLKLYHHNLLVLLLLGRCSLLYVLLWSDYMVHVSKVEVFWLMMCAGNLKFIVVL